MSPLEMHQLWSEVEANQQGHKDQQGQTRKEVKVSSNLTSAPVPSQPIGDAYSAAMPPTTFTTLPSPLATPAAGHSNGHANGQLDMSGTAGASTETICVEGMWRFGAVLLTRSLSI